MEATGFIYGLIDPRDGALRYVGKTIRSAAARFKQHCTEKGNSPKCRWMRRLQRQSLRPRFIVLHECPIAEVNDEEMSVIAFVRSCGALLLNVLDGGGASHATRAAGGAAANRARQARDAEPQEEETLIGDERDPRPREQIIADFRRKHGKMLNPEVDMAALSDIDLSIDTDELLVDKTEEEIEAERAEYQKRRQIKRDYNRRQRQRLLQQYEQRMAVA